LKKIYAIMTVAMVTAVFAFAGCQKQEAPKPAVESAPTTTMTMPDAQAAPAAAPDHN
jgi:hypothetical protein